MRNLMLTFVLPFLFTIGCSSKDPIEDTGSADGGDDVIVDGAAVYALNCSGCHGSDGAGVSGPDLRVGVPTTNDSDLKDILRNGIGSMAAPSLSGPEENALFDYLRTTFGEHGGA